MEMSYLIDFNRFNNLSSRKAVAIALQGWGWYWISMAIKVTLHLSFGNIFLVLFFKIYILEQKALKAELLPEGIIFLVYLFARAILSMKKLKIEETKAT